MNPKKACGWVEPLTPFCHESHAPIPPPPPQNKGPLVHNYGSIGSYSISERVQCRNQHLHLLVESNIGPPWLNEIAHGPHLTNLQNQSQAIHLEPKTSLPFIQII